MKDRTEIQIREAYIAKLPARLADLERAAASARAGGAGHPALADVHGILHRMVGTGGSLGLTALAQVARSAEDLVRRLMEGPLTAKDQEALDLNLTAVSDACRDALAGRELVEPGTSRGEGNGVESPPQRERRP